MKPHSRRPRVILVLRELRRAAIACAILTFSSLICSAAEIAIGVLSFDVFIPASSTPGVNAFDVFNNTGATYGPTIGSMYIADPVNLDNLSLTVLLNGGGQQTLSLGNLAPGELLDASGNPTVQFPSTTTFVSAVLTGTMDSTNLTLSNGSTGTFSPSFSVDLIPSSGMTLVAGQDLAAIEADYQTVIPEPGTGWLFLIACSIAAKAIVRWPKPQQTPRNN